MIIEMTKEKSARAVNPSVVYELRSVNLASLPEKEQGSVLDSLCVASSTP